MSKELGFKSEKELEGMNYFSALLGRTLKPVELKVLKYAVDTAKKYSFIRSITLFGSRARGDHSDTSDFDFSVDIADVSNQEWSLFSQNFCEYLPTVHSIDLIRFDTAPIKIRERILEEGKEVFNARIS